jgi:hypothetical protein
VNEILLVIDSERIEDAVHAELERLYPLGFTSGTTMGNPISKVIAFPGCAQSVLTVEERGAIAHVYAFEILIDDAYSADRTNEIKGSKYGMIRRQNF